MKTKIKRVLLVVLDGVGCGALPDANEYGDDGADTLGHLAQKYSLKIPNLERWGIGHLTPMRGVNKPPKPVASFGRCRELSLGKDTTSGHWEMAGVVVKKAFQTFPKGFPRDAIDRWEKENNLPGILGNKTASGTEIIQELGEEHLRTGKPILYTSADSVWQVACHEGTFGLNRLYDICRSARKIGDELNISRVIARPFLGKTAADFKRTGNRKDYAQNPTEKTMMEFLLEKKVPVVGVGKIQSIYNGIGVPKNIESHDNAESMNAAEKLMNEVDSGLLFINLIDFDMLYGHRRDVQGFGQALDAFDVWLGQIQSRLTPGDLMIITGDHGNDPTYRGSDHTREHVPLLAYAKDRAAKNLGDRQSFADIGQTVLHLLLGNENILPAGKSFASEMELT